LIEELNLEIYRPEKRGLASSVALVVHRLSCFVEKASKVRDDAFEILAAMKIYRTFNSNKG